jgi:hypothetical protein
VRDEASQFCVCVCVVAVFPLFGNAAEIRQKIDRLEAEIARDGTRYDQALAIGQYELANNIQIGINQKQTTLQEFHGDLREISQQALTVAQPAPFPRSRFRSDTGEFFSLLFRCWCCLFTNVLQWDSHPFLSVDFQSESEGNWPLSRID